MKVENEEKLAENSAIEMKIENNEKYEKVKIGETESGGNKLSNQKDVTIGEMGCERGN